MATKKLSFDFLDEDQKVLARIASFLSKTHGPVSNIAVIRFALRKATKGLPK